MSDVTPAAPSSSLPARLPAERETAAVALDLLRAVTESPADPARLEQAVQAGRAALEQILPSVDLLATELREQIDAKRELLIANQALTISNAELRSHNEELQVANEEAQAAMEEVETLSEEQQASNEELETLNEELQATIEELNTTNDDLEARGAELEQASASLESERSRLAAILASIGDGVLVLDRAGRTVLANAAIDQLFGEVGSEFVPEDEQGRPLSRDAWPQRRAARGETFQSEFTVTGSDGSRRTFEATSRPIDSRRPRQRRRRLPRHH